MSIHTTIILLSSGDHRNHQNNNLAKSFMEWFLQWVLKTLNSLQKENTVELRLSELIETRGGSDKWIVRIIEQHAILWN